MADSLSSKQQLDNANVLWQEVSRQLKAGIGVPSIALNRVHWRAAIEEVERLREERRVTDETKATQLDIAGEYEAWIAEVAGDTEFCTDCVDKLAEYLQRKPIPPVEPFGKPPGASDEA